MFGCIIKYLLICPNIRSSEIRIELLNVVDYLTYVFRVYLLVLILSKINPFKKFIRLKTVFHIRALHVLNLCKLVKIVL